MEGAYQCYPHACSLEAIDHIAERGGDLRRARPAIKSLIPLQTITLRGCNAMSPSNRRSKPIVVSPGIARSSMTE